ncbi:MAG TPA: hypothetical protein EYP85_01455 [Armatimonadetes bacterium]|nr:hypothetical protein [Armatimonadota bacterium]
MQRQNKQLGQGTGRWAALAVLTVASAVWGGPRPQGITPGLTQGIITSAAQEARLRGLVRTDRFRGDQVRNGRILQLASATAADVQLARQRRMRVLPRSEEVFVNGVRLRRGVHYVVDYLNRTLHFTDPVAPTALIVVNYRWTEAPPAGRRPGIVGIAGVVPNPPGIAGATQDEVNFAAVGTEGVAVGGEPSARGWAERLQVRYAMRPGAVAKDGTLGPDMRAYQIGTGKQGFILGRNLTFHFSLARSEGQEREVDPFQRRLERMVMPDRQWALTQTRSRALQSKDQKVEPRPSPTDLLSDEAWSLSLTRESKRGLSFHARLANMGERFAAAREFKLDARRRGFRDHDWGVRLALTDRTQVVWQERGLTDTRTDRGMVRETRALTLGALTYRADTVRIDPKFKPNRALDKALPGKGEFGLAQRKLGTAAKPWTVTPSALPGFSDRYETLEFKPGRHLSLTAWRRSLADAQGARLQDERWQLSLAGRFSLTRTVKAADHNFSAFKQTGYENWAKERRAGVREEITQYALQPTRHLSLTRIEGQRYQNRSGEEGKGTWQEYIKQGLKYALSARTTFQLERLAQVDSTDAFRTGRSAQGVSRLDRQVLSLTHRMGRTQLSLTRTDVTRRRNEEEAVEESQWKTRLVTQLRGGAKLSLSRVEDDRAKGRRVASSYTLDTRLGLTATFEEVKESEQPTRERWAVEFQRKLADNLTLSATHRRVHHWNYPQAGRRWKQQLADARGTRLALTWKPGRTNLRLWRETMSIEEGARHTEVGLQLAQPLSPRAVFTAALTRREQDGRKVVGTRTFGLTVNGPKGAPPLLRLSYAEQSPAEGSLRMTRQVEVNLPLWRGLTVSGHYTDRDEGETKGLATKGWSVVQQFGQGGELRASYLRNPLDKKRRIIPTAQMKYTFTAPKTWLGQRLGLQFEYLEVQKAPGGRFKGKDYITASGRLQFRPSRRENLNVQYAREHFFEQNLNARQGIARYSFEYTRTFDADHQLVISGWYANPDGQRDTPDFERYRINVDYRLPF